MEQCPVCKTRLTDSRACTRHETDVSPAIEIEARARDHFKKARAAFDECDPQKMLFHARQAFSKRRTSETRKMLVCAAVLAGDFKLALRVWCVEEWGI